MQEEGIRRFSLFLLLSMMVHLFYSSDLNNNNGYYEVYYLEGVMTTFKELGPLLREFDYYHGAIGFVHSVTKTEQAWEFFSRFTCESSFPSCCEWISDH